MTMQEVSGAGPLSRPSGHFTGLTGCGELSIKVSEGALEVRYGEGKSGAMDEALAAPMFDSLNGAVLDPALPRGIVRVAPYSGMACGDKLILRWDGLDVEGFAYQHEMVRFVSEGQAGKELVFVVKGMHIAALDGGSLEIYWTLISATRAEPVSSIRLQVGVGDPALKLLAPHIEEAVGEMLDPDRVAQGVCINLPPYARMADGDRIFLSWQNDVTQEVFSDSLVVETFAVGESVSFWIRPDSMAAHLGERITVQYKVQHRCGMTRESEPAHVVFAVLNRGVLDAPDVLESVEGVLEVEESIDGVTVVIGNAQVQEGELVYLKCDGQFFSHRDDREITREMAGQPLVFIVPHRFWREHSGATVRVGYSVEHLDDVSQESAVTLVRVEG